MEREAAALVSSLAPWISLFSYDGNCTLKNPARTEHGVILRFAVDFASLESAGERAGAKLREAIDLIYRVLSIHSAAALYLFLENYGPIVTNYLDESIVRVLMRDVPFDMEVVIRHTKLQAAGAWKKIIGDTFLVEATHAPSVDPAYLSVKSKIDAVLVRKNPKWTDNQRGKAIPVECWLETSQEPEMAADQAEALCRDLVEFGRVLDTFEEPEAAEAAGHLPVNVKIKGLKLLPMPITTQVVRNAQAANALHHVRMNCHSVTIDPRFVACRPEELMQFLDAITRDAAEDVKIDLLSVVFPGEIVAMDREVDVERFISDLLTPIVACQKISDVHLGGLLELFRLSPGRRAIYRVLVEHFLTRTKPIRLVLDHADVGIRDARLFTGVVQQWRHENPQGKLKLKRLDMNLYDEEHAFTMALVTALDEVEELALKNHDISVPPLETDQIGGILEKFQTLRALSVANIHLASMDIFPALSPPALRSIELVGLRLDNRQSFLDFLEVLGHPDEPLTLHLRHLRFTDFTLTDPPVEFGIKPLEVECLARSLRHNRLLKRLDVSLEDRSICKRVKLGVRLHKAAGSVIPGKTSKCRSPEEKARRLAFLSVLHAKQSPSAAMLDTFVVQHVFEFCNAWIPRYVSLD